MLGTAADRRGACAWHAYEDLGDATLADRLDPERIAATVDFIAELHTRAAHHPVLPDARRYGASLGIQYFTANVGDAIAALEQFAGSAIWTINVFVVPTAEGLRARLVDWDRTGVGPFSYDLSTFLFRFPPAERRGILERYRDAVTRAGGHVASPSELGVLFDTAERARYANRVIWPVQALMQERAAGGFPELAEVERWFQALDAVSPSDRNGIAC